MHDRQGASRKAWGAVRHRSAGVRLSAGDDRRRALRQERVCDRKVVRYHRAQGGEPDRGVLDGILQADAGDHRESVR